MKTGNRYGINGIFAEKAGNGVALTGAFPSETWERGEELIQRLMTAVAASAAITTSAIETISGAAPAAMTAAAVETASVAPTGVSGSTMAMMIFRIPAGHSDRVVVGKRVLAPTLLSLGAGEQQKWNAHHDNNEKYSKEHLRRRPFPIQVLRSGPGSASANRRFAHTALPLIPI